MSQILVRHTNEPHYHQLTCYTTNLSNTLETIAMVRALSSMVTKVGQQRESSEHMKRLCCSEASPPNQSFKCFILYLLSKKNI